MHFHCDSPAFAKVRQRTLILYFEDFKEIFNRTIRELLPVVKLSAWFKDLEPAMFYFYRLVCVPSKWHTMALIVTYFVK